MEELPLEALNVILTLLTASVILGGVIELLGNIVKKIIPKKYENLTYVIIKSSAMALGIYMALWYKIDITYFIREQYDTLGAVFTGIILSEGTGYTRDLIIAALKQRKETRDIKTMFIDEFKSNMEENDRVEIVSKLIDYNVEVRTYGQHPSDLNDEKNIELRNEG